MNSTSISRGPVWKTRSRIVRMASLGITAEEIAIVIGISVASLNAVYQDIIKAAVVRAKVKALDLISRLSQSGKVLSASLFWAKSFLPAGGVKKEKPPFNPGPYPEFRVMNHLGEIIGSRKFVPGNSTRK